MDYQPYARYLLECLTLLPVAVLMLMPTARSLRVSVRAAYGTALAVATLLAVVSAGIATVYAISASVVWMPCTLVLLAPVWRASSLDPPKKVYCYANAVMLISFASMYVMYVTAPWEVGNANQVLTLQSAAAILLLSCVLCVVFSRTLIVKLSALFEYESLDAIWNWVSLVTLIMAGLLLWLTPVDASNVMMGYVRPKSVVIMLLIPLAIWLFYHVAWVTASRLSEGEELKRENDLLKIEERRHLELLSYIDEARAMRHDFRHHMMIVAELANAGKVDEVATYASRYVDATAAGHARLYCENSTIDAIAAHFDSIADEKNVSIAWMFDIPHDLPIDEIDFCSILSNLVENALTAASACDEGSRWVRVKAGSFPGGTTTLVVENGFMGTIKMGKNGLPQSDRANHGIGLSSVAAIAHKHNGSLSIATEGSLFTVTVVLYPSDDATG